MQHCAVPGNTLSVLAPQLGSALQLGSILQNASNNTNSGIVPLRSSPHTQNGQSPSPSQRHSVSQQSSTSILVPQNHFENSQSSSSSSLPSSLLVDIICEVADFSVDLALRISQRTGTQWRPKILNYQKQMKRPITRQHFEDPNKPKRPHNAYTLWCEHIRQKVREKDPTRSLHIKDLAEMWKNLPELERSPWERKAQDVKQKYLVDMATYRTASGSPSHPQPSTNTPSNSMQQISGIPNQREFYS
ncbi:structure-specific recognition 1 [Cryptosporidium bovis]|uniref:structure-specific recognition 1 n=1 Tax=Cryptosporidium bovis TaxID=310047 RepID=UPI00351A833D|nr:structure-specific recognition 1 [Cryptosporidium bovis]